VGLLKFALRGNYKRYYNDLKELSKKNRESDYIPTTKVKVDGFVIPYWKEIIKMTKEAAKVNDDVNVVGWDVAITENGPLIIDGNWDPGMDLIKVLEELN